MKAFFAFHVLLVLAVSCLCAAPAMAALPGGGISVVFQCQNAVSSASCNAEGASVYINGEYRGAISGGSFEIAYDDTFTSYKITKNGYYDLTGAIDAPAPGASGDIVIDATLTQKPAGSGKGWFKVICNVDGASVAFDGATKGSISNGYFLFEVATTGTPYTSYSVSKSGYETYFGSITAMPADDDTVNLYVTLTPVVTPTATVTPIGGDSGRFVIHSNVNGASVYFDSAYKGVIANGILSVPVYTTGTPYTTYRLEKTGYVTATGSLPTAPANGVTKDVYVTLNPVQTQTQAPIGSGSGQYAVRCSETGAEVYFDGIFQGMINNGVLYVTVATTGTPYKNYEVRKAGFYPATGAISQTPANGQTVDIFVTLNPQMVTAPTTKSTHVPTTIATPEPTKSPLPLTVTLGAAIFGALLMVVSVRRRN